MIRHYSKARVLALLLVVASPAAAQTPLYQPRAMSRAYAMKTRQHDGRPGPNYWQNHGRYTIDIGVALPDRTVRGREGIVYVNDSPDTLRSLGMKLFMNVHKRGAPRNREVTDNYLNDGVQIDSFAVNGQTMPWKADGAFTNARVTLPSPLLPHDSVRLGFGWHYTLATEPAREGMMDATTAYLAYFYPRVAVYDDYEGWDTMEFTDLQEFYSDNNDYDVTVRAPSRFVVWGTGTLVNADQVLAPQALDRFRASMSSDATVRIASHDDVSSGRATKSNAENAWHFTASGVPDVAFGISDHYDWDGASVIVDSAAHRRASVQAAYNDTATDYHSMVQMARRSLAYLSSAWPGVPYPYEKTTIFQGGAGMEYPMMVNDESYADTAVAHFVAGHELAHTYMPFLMGINETRYAFMDEGWAATFEYLLNTHIMDRAWAENLFRQVRVMPWTSDSSPVSDIPIITPADAIRNPTYRADAYGKPALGYLALKDYLGDAVFAKALHEYMARWRGKHPAPWDFFNTFDDATGQDLTWFWRSWFFEPGHIDFAVRSATRAAGGYSVVVDNVGGLPAPVDLVLTFADGSSETRHENIGIWRLNQRRASIHVATNKVLRSIRLNGGIWMDADPSNDLWRTR